MLLNCSPPVLGEVIRPLIKGIFTAWKFLSALVGSEYLVPSSNHFSLFYDFNELLRQSQDIPFRMNNKKSYIQKKTYETVRRFKRYIKRGSCCYYKQRILRKDVLNITIILQGTCISESSNWSANKNAILLIIVQISFPYRFPQDEL